VAKSRNDGVVDSYAAVKVAQRAGKSRARAEGDELQKLGAQVRQGVTPTRQLIECYECGYRFQLHGRAPKTNCNKCRAVLDLSDHTINAKWAGTLKTAGTIVLASGALIEWGELVGGDIVLRATVGTGSIRAMRRLELGEGAVFPEEAIAAPELRIAAGAVITLNDEAKFHDVEVLGTLKARLHATGSVVVRAGGLLEGKLYAEHLVVEDGGGLKAAVRVTPNEVPRGSPAAVSRLVPGPGARRFPALRRSRRPG
jgi:hypothetical protein